MSDAAAPAEAVPAAAMKPNPYPTLSETTTTERKPNPYPTLPETTTTERKPNPYPTVTDAVPGKGERLRISQWVVGGVGAAALAGGVIAGLVAHSRSSDSQTLADQQRFYAAYRASESAKSMRVTSYFLLGAAGAAGILDGILMWTGASSSRRSDERSVVSLSWYSGGAGIVTSGRF